MGATRLRLFLFSTLVVAGSSAGCGPTAATGGFDGGAADAPPALVGLTGITVTPATATLTVTGGTPATTAYHATGHFMSGPDMDITGDCVWSVGDPTLGTLAAGVFTATGAHGGQAAITATNGSISGTAAITVKLTAKVTVSGGSPPVPSNAPSLFGGTSAPSRAPGVYYPYDGVLLPPNLTQLEVQWSAGSSANTLFRLAFESPTTDVTVFTRCIAPPGASTGCAYDFSPAVWTYVARSNQGAGPVQLTLAGTDDTGSSVGTSSAVNLSFATDNVTGGLYYWTTSMGTGIMRWDFGSGSGSGTLFASPTLTGGTCVGCHALSHDGKKMVMSAGGQNGGHVLLLDVASKTPIVPYPLSQRSQFETWAPDASSFVGVYGDNGVDLNLLVFDGATGAHTGDITLGGAEGDHPDYAPDGMSIVFSDVGIHNTSQRPGECAIDLVKKGASGWGTKATLLPRTAGKNHYYPSFAPDGSIIVLDTSTCDTGTFDKSCDADSDATATMYVMPVTGGAPVALANANAGHPLADAGTTALTNSFPRWNPFIFRKSPGGGHIVWLTFSSIRHYGFRSPPASAGDESPLGSFIWMTAVDLDKAEVGGGGADPSYPPFVIPFQDFTTSNHIPQWTTAIVGIN